MPNLMTAEELLQLGDDRPGELIAGEFIPKNFADGRRGKTANVIGNLLGRFIEKNMLGESFGVATGFIISRNPDTVRAPDFAFIAKERLTLISDVAVLTAADELKGGEVLPGFNLAVASIF